MGTHTCWAKVGFFGSLGNLEFIGISKIIEGKPGRPYGQLNQHSSYNSKTPLKQTNRQVFGYSRPETDSSHQKNRRLEDSFPFLLGWRNLAGAKWIFILSTACALR